MGEENKTGLRAETVRGGTYLALCQGVVIVVSVVGMLLLTREIGLGPYGIYIARFDLLGYFGDVMTFGVKGLSYSERRRDPRGGRPSILHASPLFLLSVAGIA